MTTDLVRRRARLVGVLRQLSPEMRKRLEDLKARGQTLAGRSDLLWYLLLQSAATMGNSRGWKGLIADRGALDSVGYSTLAALNPEARLEKLLGALRKAKVRMPTTKAKWLCDNLARIEELGGVERATQHALGLGSRDTKLRFMRSFHGIGEKYGRNVWMDIYDTDFRDTVAVDQRLKKVAAALGFNATSYSEYESFYREIAKDAGLEPWELDRLLYQYTDHFLAAVSKSSGTRPLPGAGARGGNG